VSAQHGMLLLHCNLTAQGSRTDVKVICATRMWRAFSLAMFPQHAGHMCTLAVKNELSATLA